MPNKNEAILYLTSRDGFKPVYLHRYIIIYQLLSYKLIASIPLVTSNAEKRTTTWGCWGPTVDANCCEVLYLSRKAEDDFKCGFPEFDTRNLIWCFSGIWWSWIAASFLINLNACEPPPEIPVKLIEVGYVYILNVPQGTVYAAGTENQCSEVSGPRMTNLLIKPQWASRTCM